MWITWKHSDANLSWPLSFEDKVDIFCEQAMGWQLHIADLLANGGVAFGEDGRREGNTVCAIRHSGFAVLQICLSYFETVGYYTGAPSGSKAAFQAGVFAVFTELTAANPEDAKGFTDALYRGARCGLYHNVRTAKVKLGWPPDNMAVAYDPSSRLLVLNPERLPKVLKAHLEDFRSALLNEANGQLRETFGNRFDEDSGVA